MKTVGILRGDGIGPEVIDAALRLLPDLSGRVEFRSIDDAGLGCFEAHGRILSDEASRLLDRCPYLLLGAFTTPPLAPAGFKSLIGHLRTTYRLGTNLRPFRSIPGISRGNFDLVIFRENTEDLYFQNQYWRDANTAVGEKVITREATQNIARAAFRYAREHRKTRIHVVTKSNVLRLVDGFFREVAEETIAELSRETGYALEVLPLLVDAAAYGLVKNPERFEILLTPNLYGDILSDLMAGMLGSLGLCPSVNQGPDKAMFEPIHGSAPDIAGKGIANPSGAILALAMMLRALEIPELASSLETATFATLQSGARTPDLGGNCSTSEFTLEIAKRMGASC